MGYYQNIRTIKSITQSEFEKFYLSKMLPIKVQGGVKDWKAISLWSPEYLAHNLSKQNVRIAISDKNVVSYDKRHKSKLKFKKMKMKKAISLILDNKALNKRYYIIHQPLVDYHDVLSDDYNIPNWADKDKSYLINFWFGEANNITPLHFDSPHNFLAQVLGRKRVKLYSPEQSEFLYPTYEQRLNNHTRILDIDNPDYSIFPKFKKAKSYNCILNPGDVLFIPSGWWHQVYSLDISISVNFWWRPSIDECLISHVSRHSLPRLYEEGKFSEVNNLFDLAQFNNHLDIAKHLSQKNCNWLAVLFAVDFFESFLEDFFSKKDHSNINFVTDQPNRIVLEKHIGNIHQLLNRNDINLIDWVNILKLAKKEDVSLLCKTNVEQMINDMELVIQDLTSNFL